MGRGRRFGANGRALRPCYARLNDENPDTYRFEEGTVRDRAGNFKAYDFTEIIHFDVAGQ